VESVYGLAEGNGPRLVQSGAWGTGAAPELLSSAGWMLGDEATPDLARKHGPAVFDDQNPGRSGHRSRQQNLKPYRAQCGEGIRPADSGLARGQCREPVSVWMPRHTVSSRPNDLRLADLLNPA
jgi:hypothetical protein